MNFNLISIFDIVHTYTSIFINRVLSFSFKRKHAIKRSQKHAKPTGFDITLTIKLCVGQNVWMNA